MLLLLPLMLLLPVQFDAEMSYKRCAQVVAWHGLGVLGSLFAVSSGAVCPGWLLVT
jgi:hypothetical protein